MLRGYIFIVKLFCGARKSQRLKLKSAFNNLLHAHHANSALSSSVQVVAGFNTSNHAARPSTRRIPASCNCAFILPQISRPNCKKSPQ